MTEKQELQFLEELEINDKFNQFTVFNYDQGAEYCKIQDKNTEILANENGIKSKIIDEINYYKIDELGKLFTNAVWIEIVR